MGEYDQVAKSVEDAGYEIFWQGAAEADQVGRLETLLSTNLPESFRQFLIEYGGGGPVGAEVSGIEDNDAALKTGGTVLGDTEECRSRYGLPDYLVVIYFHDDEVCWCLDSSGNGNREYPVVSYDLFGQKVDRDISKDFRSFMMQHMQLYTVSASA